MAALPWLSRQESDATRRHYLSIYKPVLNSTKLSRLNPSHLNLVFLRLKTVSIGPQVCACCEAVLGGTQPVTQVLTAVMVSLVVRHVHLALPQSCLSRHKRGDNHDGRGLANRVIMVLSYFFLFTYYTF